VVLNRKSLTLPQGAASLRIVFTALGLSIPERVRLRYRLDGVDRDWQEPLGRRAVSYTNLAPGRYRFEVTAANEDGVWNPQPATLDILIPPTFVQTGWFLLLLAFGAALLLYAAYAIRMRYVTRRMQERLEGRIEERSRIARSLHDTLLQSVQGLLMSFNAHVHHVPQGSRERAHLERTLSLARRLLVEGRDQIMDLRASASPDETRLALQSFGMELAEYSGYAFELRIGGRARPLRPQVSDEVYAIGREALFNASRYANASHVLLELDYGKDVFTLRIRDDGCGLDEAVAQPGCRPGHWGLPGMRERAAAIGARFELKSQAGEGTEIVVSLPGELAYQFSLRTAGHLLARVRRFLRLPAIR
jgi:signal transduction histidine kinase